MSSLALSCHNNDVTNRMCDHHDHQHGYGPVVIVVPTSSSSSPYWPYCQSSSYRQLAEPWRLSCRRFHRKRRSPKMFSLALNCEHITIIS
jgi:hypothetical protein